MANKAFVAKNGLTVNTANILMSELSGTLTPTAAGKILITDGTGQMGTRTEAQIKSDIEAGVVETVTAGNGLTGGGTAASVTVTMGAPTTLTVSTTDTVGAETHAHAITSSSDVTGGTAAILASDGTGKLQVATINATAIQIGGTAISSNAGELNLVDGSSAGTVVNSKAVIYGSSGEVNGTTLQIGGTSITSTAAELNLLDGSAKSTSSITLADADGFIVIDGTTTKQIPASDISAYVGANPADFSAAILPNASGTIDLGSATKEFNDIFLADSSVIKFGNDQEITLTHNADKGLTLKHEATGDDIFPTFTLATKQTDIQANDVLGSLEFIAPDEGSGTADQDLLAGAIRVISEGDFSDTSNASKMSFMLGSSEAATEKMSLSSDGNLTINGNLIVSGTTTTVNSTTVSIADPIFELGDGTSDDNLDRGIKMKYNSSGAKIAFMGFDDSDGKFVMIPDATDTSSVFTGTVGTLKANLQGNVTGDVTGNADTATALATARNIGGVSFDGTGAITPNEITVADESSDTTCFMLFATAATGAIQPKTGTNVTFNSGTGLVTATGFSGDLTGTLQTAAQGNVTSVGALDGGSITSGFGTIDTGSSTITTTGAVSGGSFKVANEGQIGSAGDPNAILVGASGTVALTQNETLIGASNTSVAVGMTKAFSGTIGTSATEVVLTFKGADGTASATGATNYQGGEIVLTLKKGTDVETKKLMVHHTGAPDSPGTNIFITEFATLGTELGETIAVSMGDADGTSLTTNQDKHVHLKITNPSGTDAMTYAGVAHLVEIPGDS